MAFEKLIPQIAQNPQVMLQAAIAAQQAANQRKQFAIQNSQNIGDALLKAWQMKKAGDQQAIENQMAERKMGFEEDKFGKTFGLQERKFEELDLERLAMEGRLTDAQIDHMASQDILNEVQADRLRKLMPSEVSLLGSQAEVAGVGANYAQKNAETALKQQKAQLASQLMKNGFDEETAIFRVEEFFRAGERKDKELELEEEKVRQGEEQTEQGWAKIAQQDLVIEDDKAYKEGILELRKAESAYATGTLTTKTRQEGRKLLIDLMNGWDNIASKPTKAGSGNYFSSEGMTDDEGKKHARMKSDYYAQSLAEFSAGTKTIDQIIAGAPLWTPPKKAVDDPGGGGGGAGDELTAEQRRDAEEDESLGITNN